MVRSVKGKNVDMGRLAAENRNTVAIGNMQVNAAGDSITKNGEVVNTATQRAKFFYKTVTTQVTENVSLKDSPETEIVTTNKAAKKPKEIIEDNGDIVIDKE